MSNKKRLESLTEARGNKPGGPCENYPFPALDFAPFDFAFDWPKWDDEQLNSFEFDFSNFDKWFQDSE